MASRDAAASMDFKDLLRLRGFEPEARERIALVRHRPFEPRLARVMPSLIAERPELFEIDQSVPGRPEATVGKADLIASFLGMRPGQAHFMGLYRRGASRSLDRSTFWSIVEHQALRDLGYEGFYGGAGGRGRHTPPVRARAAAVLPRMAWPDRHR